MPSKVLRLSLICTVVFFAIGYGLGRNLDMNFIWSVIIGYTLCVPVGFIASRMATREEVLKAVSLIKGVGSTRQELSEMINQHRHPLFKTWSIFVEIVLDILEAENLVKCVRPPFHSFRGRDGRNVGPLYRRTRIETA